MVGDVARGRLQRRADPLLLGERDRIKDLEPLLRRASVWSEAEVRQLLVAYLGEAGDIERWSQRLGARRRHKESR